MIQFLQKHAMLISILPPLILMLVVLITVVSSGQLATLTKTSAEIGRNTGALAIFQYIRNLLVILYIANFIVQILIKKGKDLKSLIISSLIGLFLTIFAYFIALILYDFISIFITLITNPNSITSMHK